MIETAAALADVDAICAVPGLAGVYVGPADLAISMGVDVTKADTDPAVRRQPSPGSTVRRQPPDWCPRSTPETARSDMPWRNWVFR